MKRDVPEPCVGSNYARTAMDWSQVAHQPTRVSLSLILVRTIRYKVTLHDCSVFISVANLICAFSINSLTECKESDDNNNA
jgi:hypothetical protein